MTTTEFFDSVRTGRTARLRKLLDEQPELLRAVDSNGETAVLEALYYGQPGALDVLLERSGELDIFEAAALGRASRIRELLERDDSLSATKSSDGYTPLHLAAFFGRTDAVKLLLECGSDPQAGALNAHKYTPLHAAASRGHIDTARLLLDAGADPNARDGNGDTALHLAARAHDDALRTLLTGAGADSQLRNQAGEDENAVLCAQSYGESE